MLGSASHCPHGCGAPLCHPGEDQELPNRWPFWQQRTVVWQTQVKRQSSTELTPKPLPLEASTAVGLGTCHGLRVGLPCTFCWRGPLRKTSSLPAANMKACRPRALISNVLDSKWPLGVMCLCGLPLSWQAVIRAGTQVLGSPCRPWRQRDTVSLTGSHTHLLELTSCHPPCPCHHFIFLGEGIRMLREEGWLGSISRLGWSITGGAKERLTKGLCVFPNCYT